MPHVSWDDFRLVKAISDTGSLAGAGDALGLNHSTVFRRLNALETELGSRIFERARNGYMATPAGEEMVSLAARMQEDVIDFERRVAGRDVKPSGELRVTTNDSLVAHLMTPMFGTFCRQFPEISLDVVIENRALNLSRRDADVAIRATADPPETLVGRRIASIGWCVYAHKDMAVPVRIEAGDLHEMCWIGFGDAISGVGPARWLSQSLPQARIMYRLNTVLGMSQAVEAGLGIGFLPCFIGDRSAALQRIIAKPMLFDGGLWLLTHPDLKNAARVRVFTDFIGKELSRHKALLEGQSGPGA
jgi:DNA-binding transcriptional LysR family regulator